MNTPPRTRTGQPVLTVIAFIALVPGCALIAGLPDWREATGDDVRDGSKTDSNDTDGAMPFDATPLTDGSEQLDGAKNDADETGVLPGTCDLTKPFALPVVMVDINSTETDAFARLSADERTIYFETTRLGGVSKIFRSIRNSRTAPFPAPVPLPEADLGPMNEFAPTVTPDGLTFFMHATDGSSAKALYSGTRLSTSMPFDLPTAVAIPAPARHPYLVTGGVYYVAGSEGGPYSIVFAKLSPLSLSAVSFQNPPANGFVAPVVSPDKLVFYGSANGRIWKATRLTDTAPFDTPAEVIELNDVAADQFPDWISPDGCRVYFHRTGSVSGGIEIYVAEKPPK